MFIIVPTITYDWFLVDKISLYFAYNCSITQSMLHNYNTFLFTPPPPIGELRFGVPGPSYLIGVGANSSNTVEPGSVCMSVDNVDDLVKEGNRLSLLRLNSSETAVMIGGQQALFIETANDG